MTTLLLFALFALAMLIAAGWRAVQDRPERMEKQKIADRVRELLECLFFDAVYPGYAENGKLDVFVHCQKRRLWWGPWIIVVIILCDETVRLNIPDLAAQRILRLLENGEIPPERIHLEVAWKRGRNVTRYRKTPELRRRSAARAALADNPEQQSVLH